MKLEVYQAGKCVRSESFTQNSILIGSLPTNDLRLEGRGISHLHALIQRALDGDGFTIYDVGNGGIRLNGWPISKAKLRQGDRLQIGPYQIHVQSEQAFDELDGGSRDSEEPVFLLTKRKAS